MLYKILLNCVFLFFSSYFYVSTTVFFVYASDADFPASTIRQEQNTISPEDEKLARFYVAGMFAEREKLHSGIVHVEESTVYKDKQGKHIFNSVNFFDINAGTFRFDRTDTDGLKQYIKTSNDIVTAQDGMINRFDVNWIPDVYWIEPLDIRYAGVLFHGAKQQKGKSWASNFRRFLDNRSIASCVKETPTRLRLTWKYHYKENNSVQVERILWIDSSKGFSLEKFQIDNLIQKGERLQRWTNLKMETMWAKKNDVWVPQQSTQTEGKEILSQTFDWKEVNASINPKLFTIEGLDLKEGIGGIVVIDNRLNTPFIEGKIIDGKLNLTGEAALAAAAAEAQRATARRMFWIRVPLIGIGLALIVFALYSKIQEYRTNQSNKSEGR